MRARFARKASFEYERQDQGVWKSNGKADQDELQDLPHPTSNLRLRPFHLCLSDGIDAGDAERVLVTFPK